MYFGIIIDSGLSIESDFRGPVFNIGKMDRKIHEGYLREILDKDVKSGSIVRYFGPYYGRRESVEKRLKKIIESEFK